MHRAGFVLTGGRGKRMGADKALLPFRGMPLAIHVAQIVRQAAGSVSLVGRATRLASYGLPILEDRYPGAGPLGGIHAALASATAQWNLVVACDMPRLDLQFLTSLLEAADRQDCHAVLARNSEGWLEPLCAVYRQDCLATVTAALESGKLKITEVLAPLRVALLDPPDTGALANVNTPEDWVRWGGDEGDG